METKTVRFVERTVFSRVGKPTLIYEKGSVHTLKADHANKWVDYGKAERHAEPVADVLTVFKVDENLVSELSSLTDGAIVDSAEAVGEPDSSADGPGAVAEQPRRRGRPPRVAANASSR